MYEYNKNLYVSLNINGIIIFESVNLKSKFLEYKNTNKSICLRTWFYLCWRLSVFFFIFLYTTEF